jgi:hypothetical protein
MILGFSRDIDKICPIMGYYAASSGNSLPKFRNNVSVSPSMVKNFKKQDLEFLAFEEGTDRLSRSVGRELPLDAA